MTLITLAQIFVVCLLGAMSPGPSMAVVINNAIFKGRYNGILTALGHGIGIAVYATFAVLGLGLLIQTNILIFNGLKFLSVIFLIFLGLKTILNKEKLKFKKQEKKEVTISFLQGFIIAILNPKIFIWFIAVYSQFMSIKNEFFFNIYLIAIAGIIDTFWYVTLTLAITTSSTFIFFKTKIGLIRKIQGFFFISIGIILFLEILFQY